MCCLYFLTKLAGFFVCVLIMNKLILDRNVFFWNQVVHGDGTGPSSGTQSDKVWEPLVYNNHSAKIIMHKSIPISMFSDTL